MLFSDKILLPLTSSLSGWMSILQDTGRVNLLLLKDDKDGKVFFIIYMAVQKSAWNPRSGWRVKVDLISLNKVSNKSLSYKHAVMFCAGQTLLMRILASLAK